MSVTRRTWTDNSTPTSNDGTPINNAELQRIYDDMDARWSVTTVTATGTQNNLFSSSQPDLVIFNNASDLTVTGITAPSSPAKPGKPMRFVCVGAGNVFFAHENAGSTAANRLHNIITSGNTPCAGGSGGGMFVYDDSASRWRLILHEQGAPIAWTPSVKFGGGNTGQTYSLQDGLYLVQGRRVHVVGRVTFSAKGSSTGNATFEGLPFSATATQAALPVGFYQNFASMGNSAFMATVASGTNAAMYTGGAASVTQLTEANFTNTSSFIFGGSYLTT